MTNEEKRGGWRNPASAANGRSGGRPRQKFTVRKGDTLLIERETIGEKIYPAQVGTVLSVQADELEIQAGNDIYVIRTPESEDHG